MTCWRPAPRTDPTISVMAMTATSGATGRTRRLASGKRHLSSAPATTGTMTTCTVSSRRSAVGTSTRCPASKAVSVGVMTTASSVEPAVMVTERATSARARNEMTFEAVPPGQQETRMRPAASGRGQVEQDAEPPPEGRHQRILERDAGQHEAALAGDAAEVVEAERHAHAQHDDAEAERDERSAEPREQLGADQREHGGGEHPQRERVGERGKQLQGRAIVYGGGVGP